MRSPGVGATRREGARKGTSLSRFPVRGCLAFARRQDDVGALERRPVDRRKSARADAARRQSRYVAAGVDENQRSPRMADDRLLDMLERFAALLQRKRCLRLEIGRGRHQEVLLESARGHGEAVAGKVEEREVRAFGGLGEVGDRLLEAIEIEIFFHSDRKADPLEAVRDQARVDCGVGERRVRIGAVRDDERDAAASGRGEFRRRRAGDVGRARRPQVLRCARRRKRQSEQDQQQRGDGQPRVGQASGSNRAPRRPVGKKARHSAPRLTQNPTILRNSVAAPVRSIDLLGKRRPTQVATGLSRCVPRLIRR